jgi:hypothetical protein
MKPSFVFSSKLKWTCSIVVLAAVLQSAACGLDVIEFTVREKSRLSGIMRDQTGAAREDIPVELQCKDQSSKRVTSKQGEYDFGLLDPGACRIWISKSHSKLWRILKVTCSVGNCEIGKLELKWRPQTYDMKDGG